MSLRSYLVFFIMFLTINSSAHAAPNEGTGAVTVKSFNNWGSAGSEGLYIKTNEPITNPAGCSYQVEYFLSENTSDISRAMVLAAKINNSQITFTIYGNGCSSNNRPTIVNVGLPE